MSKVLIIYRFLPQYRVKFYQKLKEELLKSGVYLQLIYGKNIKYEAMKGDEVEIPWADFIPNRYFRLGSFELIWQPCLKHIHDKDLIIVEGANRLILNYYLMIARYLSRFKLGVWGHGRNMLIDINDLRNKIKNIFIKECDGYFAYTVGVKDFLVSRGVPSEKVYVVQNSIDTTEITDFYAEITDQEINDLKAGLNIHGNEIGIFCGAMYAEKRIDFILEVCQRVKKQLPDFHMLFIGSGKDAWKVVNASEKYKWIHYFGPKFGKDRVQYFKLASIQLMPGAVGLGILDSFALETPVVTTYNSYHGPEFEYIDNGVNSIITKDEIDEYSLTAINLLKNKEYLRLMEGCKLSNKKYTMDKMVENFKNGIMTLINHN